VLSGPRPTSVSSGILIHADIWRNRHGPKNGGQNWGPPSPFLERGAGSPSNTQRPWAEAYLRAKCHLDPSNSLATLNMGRKFGGLCPLLGERGVGSPSNKVAWAEAYLHIKCHLDPCSHLATTCMGLKLGGSAPLEEGELGPHLTQCGQGQGLPVCQVSS